MGGTKIMLTYTCGQRLSGPWNNMQPMDHNCVSMDEPVNLMIVQMHCEEICCPCEEGKAS